MKPYDYAALNGRYREKAGLSPEWIEMYPPHLDDALCVRLMAEHVARLGGTIEEARDGIRLALDGIEDIYEAYADHNNDPAQALRAAVLRACCGRGWKTET